MNNFRKIAYSLVVVAITAYISSYFTRFGVYNWYALLDKPTLTPPDSYFRIIWGILYFLMVISFYMVLRKAKGRDYQQAHQIFLSQLLLQIIWCFFFFFMGYIGIAMAVIILLDWMVWRMLKNFHKTSPEAALLNYPYFIWLIYATWLNISFVYLNGLIVEI